MSYDDWKTSPPEEDDSADLICLNRQCRYTGEREEFERSEYEEFCCPDCGGTELETKAAQHERLLDEHWQSKLDERLGK